LQLIKKAVGFYADKLAHVDVREAKSKVSDLVCNGIEANEAIKQQMEAERKVRVLTVIERQLMIRFKQCSSGPFILRHMIYDRYAKPYKVEQ
jgi:hypothetical protein